MRIRWTDPRDGATWNITAVPLLQREWPYDADPMVGEVRATILMKAEDSLKAYVAAPVAGRQLSALSEHDLTLLRDTARSVGLDRRTDSS